MSSKENADKNKYDQRLLTDLREYIEKRFELYTITITEQVSLMIAHSYQKMTGMALLAMALLFLCISLAIFLGELLDRMSAGFAIVTVFIFIVGFFFYRKKLTWLTKRIQVKLISKVINRFDKKEDKDGSREE